MQFSSSTNSPFYVGGSRSLTIHSPAGAACVQFAIQAPRLHGHPLHVGCASGADSLVLSSAPAKALRIFAQFSAAGQGRISASAPLSVIAQAAAFGASVQWLAGGQLSVPVKVRLIKRSLAAMSGCGAAVFFSPGAGSLSVASHALKRGIPVLIWSQSRSPRVSFFGAAMSPVTVCGLRFWHYAPAQFSFS